MRTIQELMNLSGRVALVTGGAGHIGQNMAEAFSEAGAKVILLDREESNSSEVAKSIQDKYGNEVIALNVNLSSEEEIKAVPGKIDEMFGRLDIIVNNAAFVGTSNLEGWVVPYEEQSIDTWRQALEVNLTACFTLIQSCTPLLKKNGKGSVINIGSTYGVVGPDMSIYEGTHMGNPAAYAASKGGLIQLTRWLSTVMAPEVRVNTLTPGGVERGQPESFQKEYIKRTPLKRMASEEDYKGAALFLGSDMSSYITGHNLVVDGGWTAW
jgi:NAD(P)-dependent dehydrogenase (short-subunit alcohol dehydrogenase family)